ncbi:MAG: hypothetical protein ACI94Z_001137 [Yoonia sp.]|jgi:hypothetical protein
MHSETGGYIREMSLDKIYGLPLFELHIFLTGNLDKNNTHNWFDNVMQGS